MLRYFLAVRGALLAALVAFALPVVAGAQAAPGALVSDRPDQTESSSVVDVGFMQLELGWVFTRDGEGSTQVRNHTLPAVLARIGLASRLEGRLGFAGWSRSETTVGSDVTTMQGVGDVDVGFKYRVFDGSGREPTIAVLAALSLPVGEEGFGSDRALPTVRAAFAHTLTERLSLGYNVGAQWSSADAGGGGSETIADLLYSLVFGLAATERLGAFVESFGTLALDNGTTRHSVDAGFTLLLEDNVQLDVSAGTAVNDAADDWFLGAGLVVRLPR